MRTDRLGMRVALLVALMGACGITSPAHAQNLEKGNPVGAVETGLCKADETFALAIHGGAVFERGAQSLARERDALQMLAPSARLAVQRSRLTAAIRALVRVGAAPAERGRSRLAPRNPHKSIG